LRYAHNGGVKIQRNRPNAAIFLQLIDGTLIAKFFTLDLCLARTGLTTTD
jgi:hypothetical protein